MTIKSILYTVIARGSTILVKYASCVGNFAEVTEQILTKIPPENSKLTYSHMSFLFHYVKEDNITYLCITDDVSLHLQILSNMFLKNKLCCFWVSQDFERATAFQYLQDIKTRFEQTYGLPRIREALPYGMNSDFSHLLASEMVLLLLIYY